jgi:hypothetical protein
LKFPSFKTKALLGMTDIYIDALPIQDMDSRCPGVDSVVSNMLGSTTDSYCYHLSEFQIALIEETTLLDNLLLSLRDYYQSVKTKRQLDYEVPAGFRQHSVHQRDLTGNLYFLIIPIYQNLEKQFILRLHNLVLLSPIIQSLLLFTSNDP